MQAYQNIFNDFPLDGQLSILGRQLDFCTSISPLEIKITKIRSTNLLFGVLTMCSPFCSLRFHVLEL